MSIFWDSNKNYTSCLQYTAPIIWNRRYENASIFWNLPDDYFAGRNKAAALHYAGKALPRGQKLPKANKIPVV